VVRDGLQLAAEEVELQYLPRVVDPELFGHAMVRLGREHETQDEPVHHVRVVLPAQRLVRQLDSASDESFERLGEHRLAELVETQHQSLEWVMRRVDGAVEHDAGVGLLDDPDAHQAAHHAARFLEMFAAQPSLRDDGDLLAPEDVVADHDPFEESLPAAQVRVDDSRGGRALATLCGLRREQLERRALF